MLINDNVIDYNYLQCPSGQQFRRPYGHQDLCRRYENFIDLKYDHEVFVNAVYIYETFNPGSVIAIWGGHNILKIIFANIKTSLITK